MSLRFTLEAEAVLHAAADHARAFSHDFIGTEDIVLALLSTLDTPVTDALKDFKIDVLKYRQLVENDTSLIDTSIGARGSLTFSFRANKTLELAVGYANRSGRRADPIHLLYGIAREGGGVAMETLHSLGVPPDALLQRVISILTVEAKTSEVSGRRASPANMPQRRPGM